MIGILQSNAAPNNYEFKELHASAEKAGIVLMDYWNVKNISDYDFTLNRNYVEASARYQSGVQVNRLGDGFFWHNKLRQLQLVLPCKVPETITGSDLTFIECRERLMVPFIAKRSLSSRGLGVFKIRTQEQFDKATHCDIYQEVIWSSLGKDLRVWCLGGEVVGVMKRENDKSFKANVHQGGVGSKYPIDSDIIQIARAIYKQTGLDVMGIDLMFGDDGYVFCELNVNPGFEGFDAAFEQHTADLIIDYVKQKVLEHK